MQININTIGYSCQASDFIYKKKEQARNGLNCTWLPLWMTAPVTSYIYIAFLMSKSTIVF